MSGASFGADATLAQDAAVAAGQSGADNRSTLYHDFQMQACDEEAEYLILGDTSHQDPAIMAFVAKEQILATLQECGIEKLFVELRPDAQPYLDDLAAGRISHETFLRDAAININPESLEHLAAMLEISGEYGVQIIASDILEQTQDIGDHILFINLHIQMGLHAHSKVLAEAGYEEYAEMMRRTAFESEPLPIEARKDIAQILYDNQDHKEFIAATELFAEAERIRENATKRTDDRMLLDFIENAKAPGERVAIMIGNGHPEDRDTGIHVLVGAENSRWIALQSGPDYRGEASPDRIYDLSAGTVVLQGPQTP